MPITVRYGPAGELMQAAADIGEGQARQRQKQIDLQRVGQVREQYARQDEARQAAYEAQLEQERARMQAELERAKMAQQNRAQRAARMRQDPTAGPQRRQDTPLTREAQDAADRFQDRYEPPETQDTGYGAVRGPGGRIIATGDEGTVAAEDAEAAAAAGGERTQQAVTGLDEQTGGGLVTGRQPDRTAGGDTLTQAKQSLANMMGAQKLPEDQLRGIQQAIQNPEISPDELGVRLNQALDRAGQTQRPPGELTDRQRTEEAIYEDQFEAAQQQEQTLLEADAPGALGQVMSPTTAQSLAAEYAQAGSQAEKQQALTKFKQRLAQTTGVDAAYGPGTGSMEDRVKAVENQYSRAIREFKALADVQQRKQEALQGRMRAAELTGGGQQQQQQGGGKYQAPNGTTVTWQEIRSTAENRGKTPQQVISDLGLSPVE